MQKVALQGAVFPALIRQTLQMPLTHRSSTGKDFDVPRSQVLFIFIDASLVVFAVRCQYKRYAIRAATSLLEHDVNGPDFQEVRDLFTRRSERQPS